MEAFSIADTSISFYPFILKFQVYVSDKKLFCFSTYIFCQGTASGTIYSWRTAVAHLKLFIKEVLVGIATLVGDLTNRCFGGQQQEGGAGQPPIRYQILEGTAGALLDHARKVIGVEAKMRCGAFQCAVDAVVIHVLQHFGEVVLVGFVVFVFLIALIAACQLDEDQAHIILHRHPPCRW